MSVPNVGTRPERRAVSVSLGSPRRDHASVMRLLGETVRLERIGTDGDVARAAALCRRLDGEVDAIGIGGTNLALELAGRTYPLAAAGRIVAGVRRTPCVDGRALKAALEGDLAAFVERRIGAELPARRALFASGVDREAMANGFIAAGYEYAYGDLMFGLGIPVAIRSAATFTRLGRCLLPAVRRAPLHMLYPLGAAQETPRPRFPRWYRWATVLCGDCLYLKRHAPDDLAGKVIVTNTTTPGDLEFFRRRGVRYLVTATPRIEGRTYGTNMMEAALVAAAGKGRPLGVDEVRSLTRELGWAPHLQLL